MSWVRIGLVGLLLVGCSADADVDRGRRALGRHALVEAEGHFRSALTREPGHLGALSGLGWTYQASGQTDLAGQTFDRCLELLPSSVDCLRGAASVATVRGRPSDARRILEQALERDPEDIDVLGSLALLDLSTGDLDSASRRYETLAARAPERAEVRLGMGEVQLRQLHFEEALASVDAGLALVTRQEVDRRHEAMLWILRARVLVASTGDRVDPGRCGETLPPVLAWLDAADDALTKARATGVEPPDLGAAERLVLRRRAAIGDDCPSGGLPGAGAG